MLIATVVLSIKGLWAPQKTVSLRTSHVRLICRPEGAPAHGLDTGNFSRRPYVANQFGSDHRKHAMGRLPLFSLTRELAGVGGACYLIKN